MLIRALIYISGLGGFWVISSTAGKNALVLLDSQSQLITIRTVRWLHFRESINLHSSGKFPQQSQMLPPGAWSGHLENVNNASLVWRRSSPGLLVRNCVEILYAPQSALKSATEALGVWIRFSRLWFIIPEMVEPTPKKRASFLFILNLASIPAQGVPVILKQR